SALHMPPVPRHRQPVWRPPVPRPLWEACLILKKPQNPPCWTPVMYYRRSRQSRHLPDMVAVWLVAVLCASRVSASPREWQPLILKGSQLSSLSGVDIGHLEVLAIHSGKAEPIPFQVDEVSPEGSYVLPEGPARMPGNAVRRTFSADDEIALMLSDLG